MKIQLEINEEKILEIAQTASMNELPNAIFNHAKKEAIDIVVKDIKNKLIEKVYFSGKEQLYSEVQKYLYQQIEVTIKKLVEEKFNEKNIKYMVDTHTDKIITDWLEKKIYSRLEELKKDIYIGSSGELENEIRAADEAKAEAHANECPENEVALICF